MRYTNRRNFTLRPGNRTSNDDDVVQTAGDSRQTGDVSNRCAAFRHELWRFELQTLIDCCVEFVLHSLRNIQPMQLVMQKMRQPVTHDSESSTE